MTEFESPLMYAALMQKNYSVNSISIEQYDEFMKLWILYALQDKRYGQAFCEHFNITDITPLYYFENQNTCKRWIEEIYIIK